MIRLILAIDQGTTSTRAIAFEVSPQGTFSAVAVSQIELAQHFPQWQGFGMAMQSYQTRALELIEHVTAIARLRWFALA